MVFGLVDDQIGIVGPAFVFMCCGYIGTTWILRMNAEQDGWWYGLDVGNRSVRYIGMDFNVVWFVVCVFGVLEFDIYRD